MWWTNHGYVKTIDRGAEQLTMHNMFKIASVKLCFIVCERHLYDAHGLPWLQSLCWSTNSLAYKYILYTKSQLFQKFTCIHLHIIYKVTVVPEIHLYTFAFYIQSNSQILGNVVQNLAVLAYSWHLFGWSSVLSLNSICVK